MIEPGYYETAASHKAEVIMANENGAIGWIGYKPMAWDRQGKARSQLGNYDLVLKPRTIVLPKSELPEPMRRVPEKGEIYYFLSTVDLKPVKVRYEGYEKEKQWLKMGLLHKTREAAEQWIDWWKENVGRNYD